MDVLHIVVRHFYKFKLLDKLFERLVLTSVVYDYNFKLRVFLCKEGVDIIHNGDLFVVGRSYNRHTRSVWTCLHHLTYVFESPHSIARRV